MPAVHFLARSVRRGDLLDKAYRAHAVFLWIQVAREDGVWFPINPGNPTFADAMRAEPDLDDDAPHGPPEFIGVIRMLDHTDGAFDLYIGSINAPPFELI